MVEQLTLNQLVPGSSPGGRSSTVGRHFTRKEFFKGRDFVAFDSFKKVRHTPRRQRGLLVEFLNFLWLVFLHSEEGVDAFAGIHGLVGGA